MMRDLFDLTGKKVIVTGGTRGLGHGMAEGLMEAGASAVIFGTTDKVHAVAKEFQDKGLQCQGLVVDLQDPEAREKGFYEAVALLGGLDILVNAARGVRMQLGSSVRGLSQGGSTTVASSAAARIWPDLRAS